MKRSALGLILAIALSSPFSLAAPIKAQTPPVAPSATKIGTPVRETLPSGLRLIVEERTDSPLTAIEIRVRVGSGAETPENNGVAHAIEHLLFRGSEARAPGAIDAAIEQFGGEINARTTRDDTKFTVTVPSEKWRDALGLLAELLQTPTFKPESVEREKAVIRAEMAFALTDPARSSFILIASVVYSLGDPYRLPLMGTPASLSALTVEQIRAFHREWYRPANLTVAVVGKVNAAEVKRLVAALFPAPENAPAEPARSAITVFSSLGNIVRAADLPPAQQPERRLATVLFAFRAPAANEVDTLPLLDALMPVLVAGGQYGRLAERLLEKDGVALTVAADFLPGRTGSLVLLTITTYPKDVPRLQKAVENELRRLREDPLTEAEVDAARSLALGRLRSDSQTVEGRAARLALFDVYAPRWTEQTYRERLEKLTDTDLRQMMLRYLTPSSYAIAVIGPPAPAETPEATETTGGTTP